MSSEPINVHSQGSSRPLCGILTQPDPFSCGPTMHQMHAKKHLQCKRVWLFETTPCGKYEENHLFLVIVKVMVTCFV